MSFIQQYYLPLHKMLDFTRVADGIAPLLVRLYLAPIMLQAGYNKLTGFDGVVGWFESLGYPLPTLMAGLAVGAELIGGLFLLLGLAVRWVSIPLMITMLVAALSVHAQNGWLAIADGGSWLANEQVLEAQEKLAMAKNILQEYGNYEWLTSSGSFTILNNGVEFAMTYFIMLLVLFFIGGGRYTSIDYWLAKRFIPHNA